MDNWLLSFIYALARFSLGLLIHPYQTMQLLVEQKTFLWLTLLPTAMLGILTIAWKIIVLFILSFFLHTQNSCCITVFSFLATWVTIFIFYWQAMLFYLLIRFRGALGD